MFHYLRQLDAREDKGDNQHDDTNDGVWQRDRTAIAILATEDHESSHEWTDNPSQAIERLGKIQS